MRTPSSPEVAPGLAAHTRPLAARYLLAISLLALLLLTGLVVYLRTFQLPAPTGPYPVGTTILDLSDNSRHDPYTPSPSARREVIVQLWYPAAPSHGPVAPYLRWKEARLASFYGPLLRTHSRVDAPVAAQAMPFPVLLFSPRWGGQRTQNTVSAEDLASHGYVVASIDHPHNAARVEFADGTVIRGHEALEGPRGAEATAQERIDFWNQSLQLWAADERFVLDQLAAMNADPGSALHGRLDTNRTGAFGHSFGGAAALALCGLDPRIKAAINLDGWTFGALRNRTAAQTILLFYEGISQTREQQLKTLPLPGSAEDQLDRADFSITEQSLREFGGYRLFLAGAQHLDFSDEPLLPPFRRTAETGPTPPADVNAILRRTVLELFEESLRRTPSRVLHTGQSTFLKLTVERWPAPASRTASHLSHAANGTKTQLPAGK